MIWISTLIIFLSLHIYGKSFDVLIQTAVDLSHSNFYLNKYTIVTWSHGDVDAASDFLTAFNGSVIPVNQDTNSKKYICEQVVIIISEVESYERFLDIIDPHQCPPIRMLIVFLKLDILSEDMLYITKTSLENDITDVLILSKGTSGRIETTTYFPNSAESCSTYHPVTKHGREAFTIFPPKFDNFFRCPIAVSFIHHPPFNLVRKENGIVTSIGGIEGKLVDLIVDHLNASMKFVIPSKGNFGTIINGSWFGSIGDLVDRRADISATSAIINHGRYNVTQMTHAYKSLEIRWFASKPKEIYAWAKVFFPVLTDITFMFCMSSISFLIVSNIANKVKSGNSKIKKNRTMFNTWAIFLGQYVDFETKSYLMNGLYVLWLGYCLILRIAYQGELMKDLQKEILAPPFNSIREAIEKVNAFGGLESLLAFFDEPYIRLFYTRLNETELLSWAARISRGEELMVAIDTMTIFQYDYGHFLQTLDEPVVTAPVAVLARRRWAAFEEINPLMMTIFESGIFAKIEQDYMYRHRLLTSRRQTAVLKYQSLGWYSISACFYGLVIEWVFCTIVLAVEIVWHKLTISNVDVNKLI